SKPNDMTVTLGHSASGPALQSLAREADLLVAAVGRRHMVTADWVKPGAVVVDVGIHRENAAAGARGRITGDVEFESVRHVAGASGGGPQEGGIGVLSTVIAAERQSAPVRV